MKVLKLHRLLYLIGILCEANTFLNETCQKKTIFHSHQIICIFPSFKGIKCLLYAHLCVVQKPEEGISILLYHSQLCSFETPSLTEVGAFIFLSRGAVGHPRARPGSISFSVSFMRDNRTRPNFLT